MRFGSPAVQARFRFKNREHSPSFPTPVGTCSFRSPTRKGSSMGMRAIGDRGTNVLRGRPIEREISATCHAPVETVYELLADIQSHLEWGGTRRSKRSRLLSMEAPAGPAAVGTEFTSTGEDSMTRMTDRSVVTEAIPSRTFEFVTESSWQLKLSGKRVDWTIVHHYDIAPDPVGSRITYSLRATRATSLPGLLAMLRVPVLRSIASRISMGRLNGGMRNVLRMAEERINSKREERRVDRDRKGSNAQGRSIRRRS
jgi:hypothetical protein